MAENVLVGFEDPVRQPVVTHELPDVLDGIELWRARRQRQQGDVVGYDEPVGHVPAGPVEHDHGVGFGGDGAGDLVEVHLHGFGVAAGQDQAGTLAVLRTNGAEDIGRLRALVVRRARPCAAPRPAPREAVLLADPRLVLPPYLYRGAGRQARRDLRQLGREAFLKASSAYAF